MLVDQPRGNYRFLPGPPTLPFCNAVVPQTLWIKRLRSSPVFLFGAS